MGIDEPDIEPAQCPVVGVDSEDGVVHRQPEAQTAAACADTTVTLQYLSSGTQEKGEW
ncbi:hypothetical protein [Halovenus amylolytica]|uniref:hypothetical protein n=1 Tax=Halovenus amylolytica TaxID=2500550 RepID=UPI0036112C47